MRKKAAMILGILGIMAMTYSCASSSNVAHKAPKKKCNAYKM